MAPSAADHEAARSKLAAEDAEREEKAAARKVAAEAEGGDEAMDLEDDHDHDHEEDEA